MNILVIHQNKTLLAHLVKVLSAIGHTVTAATSVNHAHENTRLSVLETGAEDYTSYHFALKPLDLVLCAPYSPVLYCGSELHLRHILNGMAEHKKAACGILSSRKDDRDNLRYKGFTSFITAKQLRTLTVDDAQEVIDLLVTQAQDSIRNYDNRDEVRRRREHQETLNRLARAENAKLEEALRTPAHQRSMSQDYLIDQHRQEQSRLRCM
ncbi:MAG: hypothetical protein HY986_09485 [Candidatus Melainabacteria bacterium]|nr:hypothetical protein [Candidatus Melainabacteria bacterium]